MTDLNLGTKLCTNCQQNINQANFLIHQGFCFRNIVKCDICNLPYDKNKKEDHIEEFHAKIKCVCGQVIEKRFLEEHKNDLCMKRQANCIYCDIILDFDNLQEHIEFCGSRTESCDKCKRFVQAKDRYKHDITNCSYPEIKEKDPAKPDIQINSKGSRNLTNLTAFNFYPFQSKNSAQNSKQTNGGLNGKEKSFALLPCEFCNECFLSEELYAHQSSCELNSQSSSLTSFNNQPQSHGLLNRFLNRDKLLSDRDFLNMEESSDDDNPDNKDDNQQEKKVTESNENNNDSFNQIPCEFCNKLFDCEKLMHHQPVCTFSNTIRSNSIAKSLSLQQMRHNNVANAKSRKESGKSKEPTSSFTRKNSEPVSSMLNNLDLIEKKSSKDVNITKPKASNHTSSTVLQRFTPSVTATISERANRVSPAKSTSSILKNTTTVNNTTGTSSNRVVPPKSSLKKNSSGSNVEKKDSNK